MHPILIDFGTHDLPLLGPTHLFLPTDGVLFAAATLLAWWWFLRRARELRVDPERAFNLTFYLDSACLDVSFYAPFLADSHVILLEIDGEPGAPVAFDHLWAPVRQHP